MLESIVIYSVSFLSSLGFAQMYSRKSKKNNYKINNIQKNLWIILIILPVVFISTYRYNVGTDFGSYINIFNYVKVANLSSTLKGYLYSNEPFFILLNRFSGLIFSDYKGFFFMSSVIIYYLITNTLIYFEKNISISMGLFVSYMFHFSTGLNIVRQMIAAAVVFFSIRYIFEKSLIKFIICVLIATAFHNSAIISLMFYFFSDWNFKIDKVNIKSAIVTMYLILVLFSPVLIYLALRIINQIPFFNQYGVFVSETFDLGVGALFIILLYLTPTIIYIKNVISINQRYDTIFFLLLLNIPFRYLSYFSQVGGRLSLYTEIFLYITVPLTISSVKNKYEKTLVYFYFVIVILGRYVSQTIISNGGETYPYLFRFK